MRMIIDGVEVDLIKWFLIFFAVSTLLTCITVCGKIRHTDFSRNFQFVCVCPSGFVKRPPTRIVLSERTTRIQQAGFTIYCVDRPMPATNLPYHFDKVELEKCLNTLFGTKSIFLPETTVAVSIPASGFCSMSEFHMFSKADSTKESPSGYSYEMLSSSVQASSTDSTNCSFGCTKITLAGITVYLGIGGESAYRINCDLILMKLINKVHRYNRWIPFSRTYIWIRSALRNSLKPTPTIINWNGNFRIQQFNNIHSRVSLQSRNSDSGSMGLGSHRVRLPLVPRSPTTDDAFSNIQSINDDFNFEQRMFISRNCSPPITCQPQPVAVHMGLRRPASLRARIPADVNMNLVHQVIRERPPPLRVPAQIGIEMPRDPPTPVEEMTAHYTDLPPEYAIINKQDQSQPPPYWKIF